MIFKYIISALQGQNHQYRATPCDWRTEQLQALKGRHPAHCLMSPFQGLNLHVSPFHRALPDAYANKAFSLNYSYKLYFASLNVFQFVDIINQKSKIENHK